MTVTFSEVPSRSSITGSTFNVRLLNGTVGPLNGTISFSNDGKSAIFDPASNLSGSKTYEIRVSGGGAGGVQDTSGNTLASTYFSTFTTAIDGSQNSSVAITQ